MREVSDQTEIQGTVLCEGKNLQVEGRLVQELLLYSFCSLSFHRSWFARAGLDSFAALDLVVTLKVVARGKRLVLFTIHQPRIEIFHLFDKILLLAKGQVSVYKKLRK